MSNTSKSPRKVAQAAYNIAKNTLPDYNHRFSPKKFTQSQLFVCLVLKVFFKTDYRGITTILHDSPDLCKVFDLSIIPHFTTLQKASKLLLSSCLANQLLESTVKIAHKTKVKLAAVDSTGLQARHISKYFVHRKQSKQLESYETAMYKQFPKLGISCDCSNHLVLSAITTLGPSSDINQFIPIITPAAGKYQIEHILADAGYDSESNHRFARDLLNIKTTIPAKHGRPTLSSKPLKGKYREQMRTEFDKKTYGQRWQVETVMSMIKRNQGDCLRSKAHCSQNCEMMLKVLTHNIGIILFIKELFYRATYVCFLFPYFLTSLLLFSAISPYFTL